MTEKEDEALEATAIGGEGALSGRKERVGQCMSLADQNQLRNFTKEFSLKLLPHLASVLKKLHEIVSKGLYKPRREGKMMYNDSIA